MEIKTEEIKEMHDRLDHAFEHLKIAVRRNDSDEIMTHLRTIRKINEYVLAAIEPIEHASGDICRMQSEIHESILYLSLMAGDSSAIVNAITELEKEEP